jgi:hypothetical protein
MRRQDDGRARAAAEALVPPPGRADLVVKYEKQLNVQLASTLHELERLQARRGASLIPPPVVADVHLTLTPGPG